MITKASTDSTLYTNNQNTNVNNQIKTLVKESDGVLQTKVSAFNFKTKVESSFKNDASTVRLENTKTSANEVKSLNFDSFNEKPNIPSNPDLKKDVKELFAQNEQNFSTKVKANAFAFKVNEVTNAVENTPKNDDVSNTNETNTNDTYSASMDQAKNRLNDLIEKKSSGTGSNQIKTEYIYIVSDAVKAIEEKKMFSVDKLNEIKGILGKLTEAKPLSKDDLLKLKTFSTFVASNSGSLGMDKSKFTQLLNLTEGCLKAQELVDVKTTAVTEKAGQINEKLKTLLAEVSKPDYEMDANFIEMVHTISEKYGRVKDSGNPVSMALFSNYLDKVLTTMQDVKEGKAAGSFVFEQVQKDYDNFTDNLFKNLGQGKLPEADIKKYLGGKADDVIALLKDKLKIPSDKPSAVGGAGGGGSTPDVINFQVTPETQSVISEMKETLTFSEPERKAMVSVNTESVKKAMSNPKINEMISSIKSDVKDFDKLVHELRQANDQLSDAFKALSDGIKGISSEIKKLSEKTQKSDYIINKEVAELIAKADAAYSKLDLSVNSSDANPADLLKKFREIIVKLDKDLREVRNHAEEMKFIDESNLRRIKENKDRQKSLDNERDIRSTQLKKDFALKVSKV